MNLNILYSNNINKNMLSYVRSIKRSFVQGLSAYLCSLLLVLSFIGFSNTSIAQFVLKQPFGPQNDPALFCEDLTAAPNPNS